MRKKHLLLPETRDNRLENGIPVRPQQLEEEATGDSPCPCCGYRTIPNHGDALAYICPVCFWEIDLFIQKEEEPSGQNHGLTLVQARENYKKYGAVLPGLKKYCREPKENELPPATAE